MLNNLIMLSLLCGIYGTLYSVTMPEQIQQMPSSPPPVSPPPSNVVLSPVLQNIENILANDAVQKPKTLKAIVAFCKERSWQPTKKVDGLRVTRTAQHALDAYKQHAQETDPRSRIYRQEAMRNADKHLMNALHIFFDLEQE